MWRDESVQLAAPAKINLSLRVFGRRSDGFHEIDSLVAPISLADELTIECSDSGEIRFKCDDPSLPSGEDNLVVRAARLFLDATDRSAGLAIKLRKRIPHGAGLGGGSSDAASTLLALNELLGVHGSGESLAPLAAQLGSDVPFFICRQAARCRGRGEIVEPQSLGQRLPLLLVKPQFGVPTPLAYRHWQNARELPGVEYAPQEFAGITFVNDLERPVFEKFVFLARVKMWLLEQPEVQVALMSGSGSSVFAVLRPEADGHSLGERAKAALDPQFWTFAGETR
jgi:4-diphosphocytidyl-2-C-methyl-D-erythritol kinase